MPNHYNVEYQYHTGHITVLDIIDGCAYELHDHKRRDALEHIRAAINDELGYTDHLRALIDAYVIATARYDATPAPATGRFNLDHAAARDAWLTARTALIAATQDR